ncbi:MAG: ATP synthase F1 subunit epsilon [Planctomycetota bacterium]|nr:ATP synthase F1 subunit epsilon [Planctomycetota bacterium]
MASPFHCSVVTPSEAVFDAEVRYVSFPAWDGQLGVMDGRSPLLTRLGIGPMRIEPAEGVSKWFFVDGGFAQMHEGTLTILTEHAAAGEDLSAAEAEAALADANARAVAGGEDRERVEADQQRARARLALAAGGGREGGS